MLRLLQVPAVNLGGAAVAQPDTNNPASTSPTHQTNGCSTSSSASNSNSSSACDLCSLDELQFSRDELEQCGYPKRVRSLVDDAKFDTIKNRELAEERRWLFQQQQQQQRTQSKHQPTDASLSSGGVGDSLDSLAASADGPCSDAQGGVAAAATPTNLDRDAEAGEVDGKTPLGTTGADAWALGLGQIVDFPRHISQLDQCHHLLIKYEPELDPTHPGFHDPEYRERRKAIAQIAFNYKHGERIPEIDYTEKEIETWRYIYIRLKEAYARYACQQHNRAIEQLERDCGYSPDSIPQLERVSQFLERKTGWRLRPAAGLLSARDFLASLAFRVFQTTQYIRHWGNPEHSVEPDCIHELMGHIPMLCDPEFAQFSQEIGLASLGASDEQIEKFATLYWFTVEFGLCRESASSSSAPDDAGEMSRLELSTNGNQPKQQQQQLKCYGAGLLSSFGEMEHALESGKPTLKEFVPEETAVESYDDAEYQVTYYVADSFDDAKLKIKQYAASHLKRDFELAYDPYSCKIIKLDSMERLAAYADRVKNDVMHLSAAISKLRLKQPSPAPPTGDADADAANKSGCLSAAQLNGFELKGELSLLNELS